LFQKIKYFLLSYLKQVSVHLPLKHEHVQPSADGTPFYINISHYFFINNRRINHYLNIDNLHDVTLPVKGSLDLM